ncbi:glycosyltransferase [Paenibacillus sp. LMG 31456]|uniref:Glycosyltransferase n=1 Tax=Paenibacillus foliorum TaxID=2654974 RepID=A0A972K3N1_9BACL|nr:glycosyltransferase family 4 protein [Paenibacillus foliorum]NOU95107.1 glycosyltransferase [Paenibacillus foliorum]
MRILFAITRAEWGGAQVHVFDLIRHAVEKKYECILVSGEEGDLTARVREIGVKVIILHTLTRKIRVAKDFKAIMGFVQILKNEKPQLVHVHSSKVGIIGRVACRIAKIPVIFTAHGWAFTEGVSKSGTFLFTIIEKLVAIISNKIICVSDFDRNLALSNKVGNKGQLITIHNGVKQGDISLMKKNKGNIIKIIMVARFSAQKDYKTLLLALQKLSGPIKVYLVGTGELLEESKKLVLDLNIENFVEFLGKRNDVKQLLINSDIFVLTSNYEGLPISIIEAMESKLPVIASNVGGVNELVVDGMNGFLVERGDVGAVANSLQKLINNKSLREEMGMASYGRFTEMFTLEKMLDKTFSVYKSVLNRG